METQPGKPRNRLCRSPPRHLSTLHFLSPKRRRNRPIMRQTFIVVLAAFMALGFFTFTLAEEPKKADDTKEITNSIGMKLVLIPAGEFMMGSSESADETFAFFNKFEGRGSMKSNFFTDEHPQHRVRISHSFYLGIFHVTRGQFRKFVENSKYTTEAEKGHKGSLGFDPDKKNWELNERYFWLYPGFEQTDDHPVVCISWNDAMAFCRWLSRRKGRPIGCRPRPNGNTPAEPGPQHAITMETILRK